MRRISSVVLFCVFLLAGVCGADSAQGQSASPAREQSASPAREQIVSPKDAKGTSAVQEPTHSYLPSLRAKINKEMGAERLDDQNGTNGTISKSDQIMKDMTIRMKEEAAQESQREFEDRSDPFNIYQLQTQQWINKRAEKREKEFEQERRKEFEKELERERNRELDRVRAEIEINLKENPTLYSTNAEKEVRKESAVEEWMNSAFTEQPAYTEQDEVTVGEDAYKAYADQEGVSVEQVKQGIVEGKIGINEVVSLKETPTP